MTVVNVDKDLTALTMAITAEFDASAERVWQIWEDPRQLERWWGPPTYPATVVAHDLTPGGNVTYYMTGPEGERFHGWWQVIESEAPRRLVFDDGFADDDGVPNLEMPTILTRVTIEEQPDGLTVMAIESSFASLEAMEQLIEMGMEEGITLAIGQIDDLLTIEATPA